MPQRKNNKLITKTPPPPVKSQPVKPNINPQQSNNSVSQTPSMMDSMKQGFSFGIGSSIAHNMMVNQIFNSEEKKPVKMYDLYNKCLEKNDKNVNCSDILEKYK